MVSALTHMGDAVSSSPEVSAGSRRRTPASSEPERRIRLVISDGPSSLCSDYRDDAVSGAVDSAPQLPPLEWIEQDHTEQTPVPLNRPLQAVVFLSGTMNAEVRRITSLLSRLSYQTRVRCVVILMSLQDHFHQSVTNNGLEQFLMEQLGPRLPGLTIMRTGLIVSRNSRLRTWCRRLSLLHPLVCPHLSSTFMEMERLCRIVEAEFGLQDGFEGPDSLTTSSGVRVLSVPGRRRSWNELLISLQPQSGGPVRTLVTGMLSGLAACGLTLALKCCTRILARVSPVVQQLTYDTLRPESVEELQQLFNRHSFGDLQIAGYNNGINHFGWKFPGKTIVVTTAMADSTELTGILPNDVGAPGPDYDLAAPLAEATERYTVGAGRTLRQCIDELAVSDREFFVVPNFSYISMGTLFFVPVHGSGSRVSTLGDTIDQAELWHSRTETRHTVRRKDPLFREVMYNTGDSWIALRLTLLVRGTTRYHSRLESVENASADDVLMWLWDEKASHVEVRKQRAASVTTDVIRYYSSAESVSMPDSNHQPVVAELATPRDRIGRVWDRIEETPVVSSLFHWLVRTYAFHVELFLNPEEFRTFWEHHQTLPISKIQLRRVLRDGIIHSACQHTHCIAADLIMTRGNSVVFRQFVERYLPHVRTNPGKQSF